MMSLSSYVVKRCHKVIGYSDIFGEQN